MNAASQWCSCAYRVSLTRAWKSALTESFMPVIANSPNEGLVMPIGHNHMQDGLRRRILRPGRLAAGCHYHCGEWCQTVLLLLLHTPSEPLKSTEERLEWRPSEWCRDDGSFLSSQWRSACYFPRLDGIGQSAPSTMMGLSPQKAIRPSLYTL